MLLEIHLLVSPLQLEVKSVVKFEVAEVKGDDDAQIFAENQTRHTVQAVVWLSIHVHPLFLHRFDRSWHALVFANFDRRQEFVAARGDEQLHHGVK